MDRFNALRTAQLGGFGGARDHHSLCEQGIGCLQRVLDQGRAVELRHKLVAAETRSLPRCHDNAAMVPLGRIGKARCCAVFFCLFVVLMHWDK